MRAQGAVKLAIKTRLFPDEYVPRRIRFGPARGVVILMNRRYDLQREFGVYESELLGIYRVHVTPGSLVYDLGAADGLTALTFAALGASVVAFEPNAAIRERFTRNLELNPDLAARITLVAEAFTDTGDVPDFVKIDVDGAELDILEGLATLPNAVVIETHSLELENGCSRLLTARGLNVTLVPNARWRALYPEWRPLEHNRWLLATRSG